MATLTPIQPVRVDHPPVRFTALSASRAGGLLATIRAVNGTAQVPGVVNLFDDADRAAYAAKVFAATGLAEAETESALGELLLAVEAALRQAKTPKALPGPSPYQETSAGITWRKPTPNGSVDTPLTNFTAKIVGQVAEDDGAEVRRLIELEAAIAGQPTRRLSIPAAQFAGMNWPIEHLGAGAIVFAGMGLRDHARVAIQELSGQPEERQVYTHTGWRKIGGVWVYLHGGGGIGADGPVAGIEVRLAGELERYRLPSPPTGPALMEAVRASLALLKLAPLTVTVPTVAAAYLAPLREPLGPERPDFTVFEHGGTGRQKSERAALALAHFGDFSRLTLPLTFTATANAIERCLFAAKDALIVIDDYHPATDLKEAQAMQQVASRLLRGVGNGAGRSRMRSDLTLRPELKPRALPLATGERLPSGHSTNARMFAVPVPKDCVDLGLLSLAQEQRPLLALAMAGYVRWLAGRMGEVARTLPARFRELRGEVTGKAGHAREPGQIAHLYLGLETWLTFAAEVGAVADDERAQLLADAWPALLSVADEQRQGTANENPVRRFLALLSDGFASRQVYVEGRDGKAPVDGDAWGWELHRFEDALGAERAELRHGQSATLIGQVDADWLYLIPETTYQYIAKSARAASEVFPVELGTLLRRLDEEELIAVEQDRRHRAVVVRWGASSRRVIKLRKAALSTVADAGNRGNTPENPSAAWSNAVTPNPAVTPGMGNKQNAGNTTSPTATPENGPVTPVTPESARREGQANDIGRMCRDCGTALPPGDGKRCYSCEIAPFMRRSAGVSR